MKVSLLVFRALLRSFVLASLCEMSPAQTAHLVSVNAAMLTASSTYNGYTPITAFDGELSQNSGWTAQGGQKQAWLAVDLGTTRRISHVRVFPDRWIAGDTAYSYLDRFQVEVWSDDTWQAATPIISTPDETWYPAAVDFQTSKLRFQCESDGNGPQVKEIEIYETEASCVESPAGLIAWWPGDGDASDVVGANQALVQGGLGFTTGKVGPAFDLDGVNAFAQVATPTGLPLGNKPRTLALWFKTARDLSTATESALFQYGTEGSGQMFGLITSANSPGKLYFFGYNRDFNGGTTLIPDIWYHAAVTYDGTNAILYLNGQSDGSRPVELNTTLNASGLTIGSRPGSAKWQGQLDEIMLFDRALSAAEISTIYAAGSNGVCRLPTRPRLATSRWAGQFWIEWSSQSGREYQLQSTTNLAAPVWENEGLPRAGTGDTLGQEISIGTEPVKFFRLSVGR